MVQLLLLASKLYKNNGAAQADFRFGGPRTDLIALERSRHASRSIFTPNCQLGVQDQAGWAVSSHPDLFVKLDFSGAFEKGGRLPRPVQKLEPVLL